MLFKNFSNKSSNSFILNKKFDKQFPFKNAKEFLMSLFDKNLNSKKLIHNPKQMEMLNPEYTYSKELKYLDLGFRDNYIFILSLYINMYKEILRHIQLTEKSNRKLKTHLNRISLIFQSLFKIIMIDNKKTYQNSLELIFGIFIIKS